MPELPEVETIVRDLRHSLVGQKITGVAIYWERTVDRPSPEEFRTRLVGQRILAVGRRGKFVVLHLEQGDLIVHLRMTGQLLVAPAEAAPEGRHLRVVLALDGRRLLYNDARKFGRMYLVDDAEEVLGELGPEPLEGGFTAERLAACLGRRRGAVKSLLLDQKVLAGIGNIYADEALHMAGIAPQRPACALSQDEIAALCRAIRGELERGIRNRGTTLSDYRDAAGREGEHRGYLRVYGRAGQPCLRCGGEIVRARVGGRSSYHCPACQR